MTSCVIIPALNVAATIQPLIGALQQQGHAVILVDDGSTDATAARARAARAIVVQHRTNQGKGAAVRTGLAEAIRQHAELIILMDGDGQHDPQDLPQLMRYAQQHPQVGLIIGNRMTDTHTMPWMRRATNRIMSSIISRIAGQHIPDTQNGFRLVRAAWISRLTLRTNHYEIDSELIIAAARAGAQIHAVPVRTMYSTIPSHIRPVRDTIRFGLFLLRTCRQTDGHAHPQRR